MKPLLIFCGVLIFILVIVLLLSGTDTQDNFSPPKPGKLHPPVIPIPGNLHPPKRFNRHFYLRTNMYIDYPYNYDYPYYYNVEEPCHSCCEKCTTDRECMWKSPKGDWITGYSGQCLNYKKCVEDNIDLIEDIEMLDDNCKKEIAL